MVISRIRTTLWVVLAMTISLTNFVFTLDAPNEMEGWHAFRSLGIFFVPLLLVWRRTFPVQILVLSIAVCAFLPIGSSTAWIALGSYIRHHELKNPLVWIGSAATAGVTYLAVLRDMGPTISDNSMTGLIFMPGEVTNWQNQLPSYTPVLMTLILCTLVGGVIAISRSRLHARSAETAEKSTRAQNELLTQEIVRFEERERIARELHDNLGSTLAAVSLMSGSLQVNLDDPEKARAQAEKIQRTAHEATAHIHEIVRTHRSSTLPVTTLHSVADLIADHKDSGAAIIDEVSLHPQHVPSPAVSRAVYRVVQEILTNAAKHAPGQPLHLVVRQSDRDFYIEGTNPLPATPPTGVHTTTGGSGIVGVAERVEYLGGWVSARPEGYHFKFKARIPAVH